MGATEGAALMANGDENVEYTFEGNPDCDICGPLTGTTDSRRPIPPPHDNCKCTCEATCENEYSPSGSSTRYGPGGNCFIFNAEVNVICWDGSEIGASVAIDFGCEGADYDEGFFEVLWDKTGDVAAGLATGCPPCEPPLVS
jgi:hypothetical protein